MVLPLFVRAVAAVNLLLVRRPGRRATVQFIPRQAGSYYVYCVVHDHAQLGEAATGCQPT